MWSCLVRAGRVVRGVVGGLGRALFGVAVRRRYPLVEVKAFFCGVWKVAQGVLVRPLLGVKRHVRGSWLSVGGTVVAALLVVGSSFAAENWSPGQPPESLDGNVEMPGAGAEVVENGEFGSCESEGVMSYDVTTDRLVVCSSSGVWMTIPGANCMAGSVVGVRYVVSYPHETVAHGGTTSLFATASIAGGTASYTAQGLCDDGVMKVSGEVEAISCSSGYTLQGGSCMAGCLAGEVEGYSHGDMLHGETEGVSKTASISGGSARYTATASCSAGAVSISGESVSSVSCNSGYSRNGNSCMAMCSSGKVSGYSHSRLYHGGSQSVSKWVNISGGRKYYKATARCSNGSVSITSSYVSSVSCNSGYQRSGSGCKKAKFKYIANGKTTYRRTDTNSCQDHGMMLFAPKSKSHYYEGVRYMKSIGVSLEEYSKMGPFGLYHPTKNYSRHCTNCWLSYIAFNSFNDGGGADVYDYGFRSINGGNFWVSNRRNIYEPNGDYHKNCWLGYWLDSNGNVTHYNDAGCGYGYSSYLCMPK